MREDPPAEEDGTTDDDEDETDPGTGSGPGADDPEDDPSGGDGGTPRPGPGDGTGPASLSLLSVVSETDDPLARELAAVLRAHGTAINDGRYADAFALMSPALQAQMVDAESWGRGVQSSIWMNVTVHEVGTADPKGWAHVTLRAWESRAGVEGLVCTLFDMRYTFEPVPTGATAWLMDSAEARSITDCSG